MLRVIIDVDAGVDDIYALLILLYYQDLKLVNIEAITCVRGNTTVDFVYKNVQRILKLTNKQKIPVYIGENEPVVPVLYYGPFYYGKDGFGDLNYDDDGNCGKNDAVSVINKIINDNPREISLLCCGPLTNIALAIKTNSSFVTNIKEVFIMGGNLKCNCNVSLAEFNFYCDAEAAFIVLNKITSRITILPKETCEDIKYSTKWRFEYFKNIDNPVMDLMNKVDVKLFSNECIWPVYDPFLIGIFLKPEIVQECVNKNVTINITDSKHRGEMITTNARNDTKIITKLNKEIFTRLLYSTLNHQ